MSTPTRRRFLQTTAAAAGGAMLLGRGARSLAHGRDPGADRDRLPAPDSSGIEHIVVLMMENRSFDHLLGWLPGANGRQAGLRFRDPAGAVHSTFHAPPVVGFNGCGFLDPDHSWDGGRIQFNGGRMDGWLRAQSDTFALSYYERRDRPFFSELAMNFTTLDHNFCSILGPTFPNRFFVHAAQTSQLDDALVLQTLPTIWDNLAAAGVSGRYYFSDSPFLALWGDKYLPIARPFAEFLVDAALGTLPAVSYIDPRFVDEDSGTSGDDHPHADIRAGDAFMAQAFHAVASGPCWPNTVFVFMYDEWGGFFDHVAPPTSVAANDVDPPDANGEVLLGMRTPVVIASPWTHQDGFHDGRTADEHGPRIHSALYDHTSVLKLINWRFGLPNLTARDAETSNITNLAHALDFRRHDPRVPHLPLPLPPLLAGCGLPTLKRDDHQWAQLKVSPLARNWKL
ncbi:MAG TPA: alkaline phosphatase family protein [Kofleriaceae bacterium]|nr:alkaline phosphatase family protein [Kofleriaceae bacterium]